jgi:HAD superfamily hydrolase (TIGR01509 family)
MSDTRPLADIFGFPIRAVVFDMDGVIVDSERLHLLADAETFERHGIMVPKEAWNDIFGMKSDDGLRLILERYGNGEENPLVLAQEKRDRYFELAREGLDLIPGVREFIISCRNRSLLTAVTTSGLGWYQRPFLERLGIDTLFDVIVTGDEVRHGKPHPEPYLLTASRLGCNPAECVVIEDADNGIRSAKAAGCIAIGITTSLPRETLLAAGADYVINGFGELV